MIVQNLLNEQIYSGLEFGLVFELENKGGKRTSQVRLMEIFI